MAGIRRLCFYYVIFFPRCKCAAACTVEAERISAKPAGRSAIVKDISHIFKKEPQNRPKIFTNETYTGSVHWLEWGPVPCFGRL